MPRTVQSEILYDSSFFTPVQMQPRSVLSIGFANWAKWASRHLASFPQLIRRFGVSFVIVRIRIDYLAPFRFLDGDRVIASTGVQVDTTGRYLRVTSEVTDGDHAIARAESYARCVRLDSDRGFGAETGRIPDVLNDLFHSDEQGAPPPPRVLQESLETLEAKHPAVAGVTNPVVMHRGLCEVADQWSFVEIPAQLGAARETLVAQHGRRNPRIRSGLTDPVRGIEIELMRPFFLLDEATFAASVHHVDDSIAFSHRLVGRDGRLHGLALETFDAPDEPAEVAA
ncbi:acyl-CoA thioesterase family protein [Couchioplanes caeruleus]|uniref:Acyl-CoA thioesterase FadM n=2 Tax=Couchioplanes caeruleus TaxID=56438 RepID=A0A1K0FDE5_9ACTN|nr:hypothetical protein [Couchioplanes caeruleus]OJF10861.1 hypothetical protein BG844_29735 [Couchioplanes caeruleus subsp. caeruleus]ROP32801.1 hypothetical protein EDD30_5749 [Couchioplanes caeruleus]